MWLASQPSAYSRRAGFATAQFVLVSWRSQTGCRSAVKFTRCTYFKTLSGSPIASIYEAPLASRSAPVVTVPSNLFPTAAVRVVPFLSPLARFLELACLTLFAFSFVCRTAQIP